MNLNDSEESRKLIVNIILKKDYTVKTFKNGEYNTNCLARRTKEIMKEGKRNKERMKVKNKLEKLEMKNSIHQ